jgi:hypothetical protein
LEANLRKAARAQFLDMNDNSINGKQITREELFDRGGRKTERRGLVMMI